MKSIFETLDFRTYLLEFYQEHKAANARFSWRVFSKKAGFTSPVFLKLLSEGKRNLGEASIDQVGEALELKDKELEFIKLSCSELTYREIADKMFVSPRTIDGYRDSVFLKLGVKTRVGIVLFAIKNNLD